MPAVLPLAAVLFGALLVGAPHALAATDPGQSADAGQSAEAGPSTDPGASTDGDPGTAPDGTTADRPALVGADLVTEAARHEGKPYRYGAIGPARFDCSGFTRYVYGRFGRALPHNSAAQYSVSRKVARSDKEPGDLIFTRTGSGRISHVGIYAGDGRFWVAPKTGDHVRLQRIFTSRYLVGRP